MTIWLVPRDEMTPEQIRAIELDPREHRVIFGAPGSGKTQVLLHRARHLSDALDVQPERFRIFVFTNALKDYIQSALQLLDLPEDSVVTLDDWCRHWYRGHIGGRMPWDSKTKTPDFTAIRYAVLEHIRAQSSFSPPYDFVLVDEGQDLEADSFDLLRIIAKHVTVCMDNKQQIYEGRSSETDILRRLGLRKRNVGLLEAFRCSPYIAALAAEFIDDPEDRTFFLRQTRTAQTGRETPLLYLASDFKNETERLVDIVRVRLDQGERIAILFPMNRQVHGFAQGLRNVGLEVETKGEYDFSSDRPKLMTYHAAKGLTFDTVLMPRLVPKSFSRLDRYRVERLLFVGIARATKWVYMSSVQGQELPSLERVRPLAAQGLLTIQEGAPVVAMAGRTVQSGESAPTDDDDLLDLL